MTPNGDHAPSPADAAMGIAPQALGRSGFAHASEAEMSRILDFYGVEWRYEPTTFPILWNLDGEVVESFSPDFYLPELDLYLEMTTLKQSLVRKKNRKLRRLRELYPDIRIKLFYARDFRAMMLKYGRLGLAESLSGISGQLVGGELAGEARGSAGTLLEVVSPRSDPVGSAAEARSHTRPVEGLTELGGAAATPLEGETPATMEAAPEAVPGRRRRRRARRRDRGAADVDTMTARRSVDA